VEGSGPIARIELEREHVLIGLDVGFDLVGGELAVGSGANGHAKGQQSRGKLHDGQPRGSTTAWGATDEPTGRAAGV
jgi:hypothetical protein